MHYSKNKFIVNRGLHGQNPCLSDSLKRPYQHIQIIKYLVPITYFNIKLYI